MVLHLFGKISVEKVSTRSVLDVRVDSSLELANFRVESLNLSSICSLIVLQVNVVGIN